MSILQKSLKDYVSPRYVGLSFAVLLVPLVLFGILLTFGGMEIIDLLNSNDIANDPLSLEYPFLAKILQMSIVQWILGTLFFALGGYLAVLLSLLVAIITLGFLTPYIVKDIQKSYYASIDIEPMSSSESLRLSMAIFLKFFILLLICLPFFWVPLMINVPFFYLFYKFLLTDIGSQVLSKEELGEFEKRYFKQVILISLGFFVLSLIPFLGIFLQVYFVIYFSHFFFLKAPNNTLIHN